MLLGALGLACGGASRARWLAPRVALSVWVAGVIGGAIAARTLPERPASPPPVPAALAEAPNLILVVVGALRADAIACPDHPGAVPAPALCRIAATRYDGFTHAGSTRPAVATLLTSLLPSRHGASDAAALPGTVETLAESLAARGYATGAVVASPALGAESGLAQGFGEYHALPPAHRLGAAGSSARLVLYRALHGALALAFPGFRAPPLPADASAVGARALAFLARHRTSRFFLFVHYADLHPPYVRHPYGGAGERALYHGEVAYLDGRFARLVAELEALGLYDDAVIVLAGDHGTGRTFHEEQLRVPLFVKWRRGEAPAPGGPARLLDVAPTLLARAGAPAPAAMQGVDLATGSEARGERVVVAEADGLRAVRTQRWKWIESVHGLPARALFDLAADPGETVNVAEREPGTWAELRRLAAALSRR